MNPEKERIKEFVESQSISNRSFAEKCGLSSNFLSGENAPGSDKLNKIHLVFNELNMDWVITGRGQMLYSEPQMIVGTNGEGAQIAVDALKDLLVKAQTDLIDCLKQKERIVEGYKQIILNEPLPKEPV